MGFLHTEQNRFNILMKQEKNWVHCPPVMRFILSRWRETIRKNCPTDAFISYQCLEQIMGNSNTGNQRFVNAAYQYIRINGKSPLHEITDYIDNNLSSVISQEIKAASSLLAIHPMFRRAGYTKHRGNGNTYTVSVFDIVPEEVVVAKLFLSMHEEKSMSFAFRKYPAFIRKQVKAMLDSPNLNTDELKMRIDNYMEMLEEDY